MAMHTHQVIILILLYHTVLAVHAAAQETSTFVAAVYEHAVIGADDTKVIPSRQEALDIVMLNMDIYEQQIHKAKEKNASIIVFPEYGLTGFGYTRESFKPFLEDIPDPKQTNWTACKEPALNQSSPILYRLSCLASNYNIYLVVNMGDVKVCSKEYDPYCPSDGRYQFNTNVVFDDKGKLVARYHKQHPFLNEMKTVNRPRKPEYSTFQTPFGKFGTMICFDVLFYEPAIPLVSEHNIDHVVFPTAWFDVLPLFAAVGFHGSWARGMGVNFLGANTHLPQYVSTGSGIYSPNGAKAYYRSLGSNGSLLIETLQTNPRNFQSEIRGMNSREISSQTFWEGKENVLPKSDKNSEENGRLSKGSFHSELFAESPQIKESDKNEDFPSITEKQKVKAHSKEDSFYSDLFGDLFQFKKLSIKQDSITVCYNESDICCSLDYNMSSKRTDELYALGVFNGLHTLEGKYYIQVCTLIKCLSLDRSSCGQQTYTANTTFDSFILKSKLSAKYVFPQVVADGVTLLPGEWKHNRPVTFLKTEKRLSKGLLSATLFGRVYKLDNVKLDPPPSSGLKLLSKSDVVWCLLTALWLIWY